MADQYFTKYDSETFVPFGFLMMAHSDITQHYDKNVFHLYDNGLKLVVSKVEFSLVAR